MNLFSRERSISARVVNTFVLRRQAESSLTERAGGSAVISRILTSPWSPSRTLPTDTRRSALMRLAAPAKSSPAKTEQIILFRVSGHLFAVSSASVQEVRSADSMSGAAMEISAPGLRKVRHAVRRGERSLFIVNGAMHFGLHAAEGALLFVLRKTRTALLIDGIDKMATMTRLQA